MLEVHEGDTVKFQVYDDITPSLETGTVEKVLAHPKRYLIDGAGIVDGRDVTEVVARADSDAGDEGGQDLMRVVLKTRGFARGRQVLDQEIIKVREDDGRYRDAKSSDFDAAIKWLQSRGFVLKEKARPRQHVGTIEVTYIYEKTTAGQQVAA
jgi:hypothetical protein